MIQKIHITRLRPGMYITDFGAERPPEQAARNRGYLADPQAIETLKNHGILFVSIDTGKGLDAPSATTAAEAGPLPLAAEMEQAKSIHRHAVGLMKKLLSDLKLGRAVHAEAVGPLVDDIAASVGRNPNALLCLGMIRHKDDYLMEHSVNLAVLMTVFGKHLGLEQSYIRETAIGALLHDLGKIRVPDAILHKPGKLTDQEFAVMRAHPAHSLQILQSLPDISPIALETAGQHHEKIDGTGYPHGLSKAQLSLHGRMLAIVDVYDAVTADRCYHGRVTSQEALRRMLQWTHNHLDGELLQQFIKAIGVYPVGSLVCLASGKMGVVLENNQGGSLKPLVRVFYNYKQRHYLPVEDVDMLKARQADRILKTEDPRTFGIDIRRFMSM